MQRISCSILQQLACLLSTLTSRARGIPCKARSSPLLSPSLSALLLRRPSTTQAQSPSLDLPTPTWCRSLATTAQAVASVSPCPIRRPPVRRQLVQLTVDQFRQRHRVHRRHLHRDERVDHMHERRQQRGLLSAELHLLRKLIAFASLISM